MKISLSSRVDREYLLHANEIVFEYKDRNAIPLFLEKYQWARINLRLPIEGEVISWNEIKNYKILAHNNFIVGVANSEQVANAKENNIEFYHQAPLHSFQELRDLRDCGASEVILGAPLFFCMDKVKRNFPEVKIRAIANQALPEGALAKNDGICGIWIRPEDLPVYEPYVDTIGFFGKPSAQEALYRIYFVQKEWRGDINLIIQDLDTNASNRLLQPDLGKWRLNCGHRCMENGSCQICPRAFKLADREKMKRYAES